MGNIKDLLIYKVLREVYYWLLQPFIDLAKRIKGVTKDHVCEKKLGITTVGNSPVNDDVTLFRDSAVYMPTPYNMVEKILESLRFEPDDIFVDLGCGKGRIIFSVAAKKLKKIIGIEARNDMFEIAKLNLKNLKARNTPVEVVNTDVAAFDMREGTVFFMFSPFGRNTQMMVMENIRKSLAANPRKIRIICYGGPDLAMLEGCGWLERETRTSGGQINVWRSK